MTKTQRHVTDFLNQIDLEGRVADVGLRFLRPRRHDSPTNRVVKVVEWWVIAQAKTRYGADFDSRNPSDRAVGDARDIAAALHLLIKRSARSPRRPNADDPAQMTRLLEALEPDFPELDFCPFAGHRSLYLLVVLAIYAAGARAYKMVSCNDLGRFENDSVCVVV